MYLYKLSVDKCSTNLLLHLLKKQGFLNSLYLWGLKIFFFNFKISPRFSVKKKIVKCYLSLNCLFLNLYLNYRNDLHINKICSITKYRLRKDQFKKGIINITVSYSMF